MTQKNNKLSELESGQKIKFLETRSNGEFGHYVEAALPESYGFSVGSEIGTPFAGYATDGMLAKVLALQGTTAKAGLVTTKIYQGPQLTEMDLSLNFAAYYSARDEVVTPILKLMLMSIGTNKGGVEVARELLDYLSGVLPQVARDYDIDRVVDTGREAAADNEGSTADRLIRFFVSSNTCQIQIGDFINIEDAFISSVSPSFSNVLDANFYPMSATCSVQVQMKTPFSKETLGRAFVGVDL